MLTRQFLDGLHQIFRINRNAQDRVSQFSVVDTSVIQEDHPYTGIASSGASYEPHAILYGQPLAKNEHSWIDFRRVIQSLLNGGRLDIKARLLQSPTQQIRILESANQENSR